MMNVDGMPNILQLMRQMGVDEFEYDGLRVKFSPYLSPRQANPHITDDDDLASQEKADAVERFKEANTEDDLFWST